MGLIGIHEITHLIGPGYDDARLAQAAHDVADAQGYDFIGKMPLPKIEEYPTRDAWIKANSNYYSGLLFDMCKKNRP